MVSGRQGPLLDMSMYMGHVECFPYKFPGTLSLIPSAEGGHTVSVALWCKQGTFMTNLLSHSNFYVDNSFRRDWEFSRHCVLTLWISGI